jgi:hypothetical protein
MGKAGGVRTRAGRSRLREESFLRGFLVGGTEALGLRRVRQHEFLGAGGKLRLGASQSPAIDAAQGLDGKQAGISISGKGRR